MFDVSFRNYLLLIVFYGLLLSMVVIGTLAFLRAMRAVAAIPERLERIERAIAGTGSLSDRPTL